MIKTIIVDDEPLALKHLASMLQRQGGDIDVVAMVEGVEAAIDAICEHNPDVVFLDIDLDGRSSFEILAAFPQRNFEVVFVTALEDHGIRAIKHNALDYILKPVNKLELFHAIEKVERKIKGNQVTTAGKANTLRRHPQKISIATTEGLQFIDSRSIVYCESEGRYTRFFIAEDGDIRKLLVSKNIGEYEQLLPQDSFFRIHHHYIINLEFIERYIKGNGGVIIMKTGAELPVSKRKKEDFLRSIEAL